MALAGFAPSAYASFAVTSAGATQAVPGGGGVTLLITNTGPSPASVKLGASAAPTQPDATQASGVIVNAGQSLALTVGANTYISGTALGMGPAVMNLAQGT